MSVTVARRLQEIAACAEERRRRTSDIRRRASLAASVVDQLRREQNLLVERLRTPESGTPAAPAADESRDRHDDLEQVSALLGGDVLEQVGQLLREIDTREREHWNEDDTLILSHLREAWAAAARQGYTVQDLQRILEGLASPGGDD